MGDFNWIIIFFFIVLPVIQWVVRKLGELNNAQGGPPNRRPAPPSPTNREPMAELEEFFDTYVRRDRGDKPAAPTDPQPDFEPILPTEVPQAPMSPTGGTKPIVLGGTVTSMSDSASDPEPAVRQEGARLVRGGSSTHAYDIKTSAYDIDHRAYEIDHQAYALSDLSPQQLRERLIGPMNTKTLRRAILWNEILGKPVASRRSPSGYEDR